VGSGPLLPDPRWAGAGASSAAGGGSWRSARSSQRGRESRPQGEGAQRDSRGGSAGQESLVNTGVPNVHAHGAGTAEPNANATVIDGFRGEPGAWRRARRVRGCGPGKRAGRKTTTAPRLDSTTTGSAAPVSAARRTLKPRRWPRCTGYKAAGPRPELLPGSEPALHHRLSGPLRACASRRMSGLGCE
jgi:hypothetical protein